MRENEKLKEFFEKEVIGKIRETKIIAAIRNAIRVSKSVQKIRG